MAITDADRFGMSMHVHTMVPVFDPDTNLYAFSECEGCTYRTRTAYRFYVQTLAGSVAIEFPQVYDSGQADAICQGLGPDFFFKRADS